MKKYAFTLLLLLVSVLIPGLAAAAAVPTVIHQEAQMADGAVVVPGANAFVCLTIDRLYEENGVTIGMCESSLIFGPSKNCRTFEQLAEKYSMTLLLPAYNKQGNTITLYGYKPIAK